MMLFYCMWKYYNMIMRGIDCDTWYVMTKALQSEWEGFLFL